MRVRHLLTAIVVGLVPVLATGCTAQIAGQGVAAEGAALSASTASSDPSDSSTTSPAPAATPTVDPAEVNERLACVLTQATIRATNDRFNAAKTRAAQLTILKSGANTLRGHLRVSKLPGKDKIQVAATAVLTELNKLIAAANRGHSPSTTPYNTATTRLATACERL